MKTVFVMGGVTFLSVFLAAFFAWQTIGLNIRVSTIENFLDNAVEQAKQVQQAQQAEVK